MAPFEKIGIFTQQLLCELPFRVAGWIANQKKSLDIGERMVNLCTLEVTQLFHNLIKGEMEVLSLPSDIITSESLVLLQYFEAGHGACLSYGTSSQQIPAYKYCTPQYPSF